MAGQRLNEKEAEILTILTRRGDENWEVRYFDEVVSTMEAARTWATDLPNGKSGIVVADAQSAGKGRQGRSWESLPGNLMATYVFFTELPAQSLSGLSLVVGLALQSYLTTVGCRVKLKWPNDILTTNHKKLAGILIEVVPHNGGHYVLIGVGLNLVAKPASLELSTSIKELSDKTYPPFEAAAKIAGPLNEHVSKFFQTGFAPFQQTWIQNAAFIGRDITVHGAGGQPVTGMLLDVSKEGLLRVVQPDGKTQTISSGDVTLIE